MKCLNCGKDIADGAKYCPYCGEKVDIIQENTNQ
jgi:DNA-directed RNA polymerase subunit RPC12/RpoP